MITIRKAILEDSDDILRWRNDSATRFNSFNSDIIPEEQHNKWFTSALKNPDRVLLIGLDGSDKIGIVRFDIDKNNAEININIAPEMRGKGYGARLISAAVKYFADNFGNHKIIAKIKKQNIASQKAFEKAGFVIADEDDIVIMKYRES